MKNIYKILFVIAIAGSLNSCDETIDPVIYNGDETQNRTFLSFPSSVVNLPVNIDDVGSATITLNSSTISNTSRTFNINIVAEETTANPLTYSLPASVTIEANSHQGTITVDGMDNGLVEPSAETLVISLDGLPENVDMDENKVTIRIFEVCPIPSDYMVGNYQIQDVVAVIGPANGTENFAAGVVNISVNPVDVTARQFDVGILPAFAGVRTVNISLVCNTIILGDVIPNLTCDGANAYIFTQAGANNSSYSVFDDSSFLINYVEDPFGSCGGPFNTSFMLTKL